MTEAAAVLVPRLSPDAAWTTVDDDIVALDPAGGVHVITATGALLWTLLDGVTTAAELAADVADVFGIDPDVALDDVQRFVDDMVRCGLVVGPNGEDGAPAA